MNIKISYAYGQRSKHTFRCKAIDKWINSLVSFFGVWVDPFYGESCYFVKHYNDIRQSGIDSHDWIKTIKTSSVDGVLFDPPYSMEQCKRSYESAGISGWQKRDNKSGAFPGIKNEISRILKPGGVCFSFGWSSVGMGTARGFVKKEILLVCHGGSSRDTICVVEVKKS